MYFMQKYYNFSFLPNISSENEIEFFRGIVLRAVFVIAYLHKLIKMVIKIW